MNMVLVDCTEIKRKLLDTVAAIKLSLYQSMYEHVKRLNNDVYRKIDGIKEALKPKAETTAKLLELEAEIDRVKKSELSNIKHEFNEMRLWMGTLYDTGSAQLLEENFVSVCLTATCVYTLAEKVDYEELRINREKEELEKLVKQQASDFKIEVDRLDRELEILIEECSLRKQYAYYNKSMKTYAEKTELCQRQMQHINTQEDNLGWPPTLFP
jgi:exonuclease VII large subunit